MSVLLIRDILLSIPHTSRHRHTNVNGFHTLRYTVIIHFPNLIQTTSTLKMEIDEIPDIEAAGIYYSAPLLQTGAEA